MWRLRYVALRNVATSTVVFAVNFRDICIVFFSVYVLWLLLNVVLFLKATYFFTHVVHRYYNPSRKRVVVKGMYVFLKSRFLPLRRQETLTKSSVILHGEKAKYNFETFFGTYLSTLTMFMVLSFRCGQKFCHNVAQLWHFCKRESGRRWIFLKYYGGYDVNCTKYVKDTTEYITYKLNYRITGHIRFVKERVHTVNQSLRFACTVLELAY
jgi:hypothetical protein